MYRAQESLHAFLRNLPNRWAAAFLRIFIFPRGRTYSAPADELGGKIVELMTTPGEARERLSQYAYTTLEPGNPLGLLEEALELAGENAPLERRLRQAYKGGVIGSEYLGLQIDEGVRANVIDKKEAAALREYHDKVAALLAVDDFAPEDLARGATKPAQQKPASKATKKTPARKKATKKKTAKKKVSRKKKTS